MKKALACDNRTPKTSVLIMACDNHTCKQNMACDLINAIFLFHWILRVTWILRHFKSLIKVSKAVRYLFHCNISTLTKQTFVYPLCSVMPSDKYINVKACSRNGAEPLWCVQRKKYPGSSHQAFLSRFHLDLWKAGKFAPSFRRDNLIFKQNNRLFYETKKF